MDEYLRKSLHLAASGRPLVFLDTETTGLISDDLRPVAWQIGYIRRTSRRPDPDERAEELNLNIGEFLVPDVCRICKVESDYPMRKGRNPVEMLEALGARLDGAIPIGHNYDEFDSIVLRNTYERYHVPVPSELRHTGMGYSIDTLPLARTLMPRGAPGSPADHNNETLAAFFGATYDAASLHSALADARLTQAVFDALISKVQLLFRDELFRSETARRAAAANNGA